MKVVAVAALLAAACSSVPPAPSGRVQLPPDGWSRIYVAAPNMRGCDLTIDGHRIAVLRMGEYVAVDVRPGQRAVQCQAWAEGVRVEARAGAAHVVTAGWHGAVSITTEGSVSKTPTRIEPALARID